MLSRFKMKHNLILILTFQTNSVIPEKGGLMKLSKYGSGCLFFVFVAAISLGFQNCSRSFLSEDQSAGPSIEGQLSEDQFVEGISELTVQNLTQNSEVKDGYLYVGENYNVYFLNRKLRNDAELTIEIQSTSTAICLLRRDATSKHAHKGSCSGPGVLDLKITFQNPGQATAVEQRKFFVIPRNSTPPENQVPISPDVPASPQVPANPGSASAAFLESLEFEVSGTSSKNLFEQKFYTLSFIENLINLETYKSSTYKITKASMSSSNCIFGTKVNSFSSLITKASYAFICYGSGKLVLEIQRNNESSRQFVEYNVVKPESSDNSFIGQGMFLFAEVPFASTTINRTYPITQSSFIDLFIQRTDFAYGVYLDPLMDSAFVRFEVVTAVSSVTGSAFNCEFNKDAKPTLKPNAIGTLSCEGHGTLTIKITYVFADREISRNFSYKVF